MKNRKRILIAWLAFLVCCIAFFLYYPSYIGEFFNYLSEKNLVYIYILIFVLGIVRSFTLIPVTYLILLGLVFLPALPLFFIIISGVMVSSYFVYYFFEYLHVDKMLERKHQRYVEVTRYYLNKYEFPVILLWSMNPFLPSDIICYVSGTLRINIYKFLLAMFIGEGITCAIYIFGGKFFLNSLFGLSL